MTGKEFKSQGYRGEKKQDWDCNSMQACDTIPHFEILYYFVSPYFLSANNDVKYMLAGD